MPNPTTTFVNELLNDACLHDASDIHFYPFPQKDETFIYYRKLGERMFIRKISLSEYNVLLTHLKFTANMDIGEMRLPQSGILSFQSNDNNSYSLRLSTLPLATSESITIRLLKQEEHLSFNQLFLFPHQGKQLKKIVTYTSGLVLLTGPTGSGKSTSMYAMLMEMMKKRPVQAITIEDPVEKQIPSVLQVEINERAGVTYQTGLKAALRHDPDIILIGEIRDEQTATYAIRAALTGHLVLSTLHAKNAESTIDRLIDLDVDREELKQTLLAVIAMELLPIQVGSILRRRAAIFELLHGETLAKIIGGNRITTPGYDTFEKLRKKAFAYGFISKDDHVQFQGQE